MLFPTLLLLTTTAFARDGWGPSCLFTSKGSISSMIITLQPGYPPASEKDFVAIWPGLWNGRMSSYDLVQAVTSAHVRSYMKSFCDAKPGQWCTQVYVLRTGKPITPVKGHAVDPEDRLLIEYVKGEGQGGKWKQKVTNLSKGGTVLGDLEAGDKPANHLDIQTELQGTARGTGDDQIYSNLTVILQNSEPNFGKSMQLTKGAKATGLRTTDGGKTWKVDRIVLPAMLPGTSSRPKETITKRIE